MVMSLLVLVYLCCFHITPERLRSYSYSGTFFFGSTDVYSSFFGLVIDADLLADLVFDSFRNIFSNLHAVD